MQVGAIEGLVKEKETWRKERRQTVREIDLRGETRVSDSEGVRREKANGREKAYHEREKAPKNYVSHGYRRK